MRREFLRIAGLSGAAGLVGPSATLGQEPPTQEVAPGNAEVDARMALVLARFGTLLDDEARDEVRRQVEGVVRQGRQLRDVALENGDGPFPVFRPYRAPLA